MTTGTLIPDESVVLFPVASIIVDPDRQREVAEPDDMLVDSIASRGLLQPIVIHADGTLVAGERRFRAHVKLGKTTIRATILEGLSPLLAFHIELEENLARKQLSWQEEVRAIAKFHSMKVTAFTIWTQLGTANDLSVSQGYVSKCLLIAEKLDDPEVSGCPTFNGAWNLLTARAERAKVSATNRGLLAEPAGVINLNLAEDASKEDKTAALLGRIGDITEQAVEQVDPGLALIAAGKEAEAALLANAANESPLHDIIISCDFLEWASTYEGPKFEVIHCDFPYGKGYTGSRTRRTGKARIAPMYADDPDIYFGLVEGFLQFQDNFCFEAAHCLFWFDMQYYDWTIKQFEAAGWKLTQPFPYIWTKGYSGVASDPKRRPRHCYETALLFSRGDRKIAKLDKDHFECLIDEKLHMNQKPLDMLKHLLSIYVDEHTALLDPTCGSGMALVAAGALGVKRMLGLELDESNAEVARHLLARYAPKPSNG